MRMYHSGTTDTLRTTDTLVLSAESTHRLCKRYTGAFAESYSEVKIERASESRRAWRA